MLGLEADRVAVMRLETAEITNGTCEARTFCKVAGGVPISFHPISLQSKIDHRAQKQYRRQRMFPCARIGGRRKNVVVIASDGEAAQKV
jgi:hypothetical protein